MATNGGLHEASPDLRPKRDAAYQMATSFMGSQIHSMTLKAVLALGIPDILAKADGRQHLSAQEILAKLPTKSTPGPNSVSNLTRVMRPLVQRGVFSEILNSENQFEYGLTEISKWYTRDDDENVGIAADYYFAAPVQATLANLHEVILDEDAIPFSVANGMHFYEYWKKHPETGALLGKFLDQKNKVDVREVMDALEQSDWLEGVKTFVDVGGGRAGIIAGEIAGRYPHIQSINFDQPHVFEGLPPEVKGVKYVSGDVLKEVPSGDVMFLKNVVHNQDDEVSVKFLKSCFKALPIGGKCIICEALLKDLDYSSKAMNVADRDIFMLGYFKGGRQRSLDETQKIMEAAGFSQLRVIESPTLMDLIVGIKE